MCRLLYLVQSVTFLLRRPSVLGEQVAESIEGRVTPLAAQVLSSTFCISQIAETCNLHVDNARKL
jgi:hypothetical protein